VRSEGRNNRCLSIYCDRVVFTATELTEVAAVIVVGLTVVVVVSNLAQTG
jgi:hypothetical protein